MLFKTWTVPVAMIGTLFCSSAVFAENEQGTGDTCICAIGLGADSNGALVLQYNDGQTQAIGRTEQTDPYREIILDAVSPNEIIVGWGKAEVLIGCDMADVIVSRKEKDEWYEVLATQVTTDYCP